MHFCSNCQNMYYLKIKEGEGFENSLIYYCRNCGHEDTNLTSDNVCVSETQLRRSEQKFTHMVNEYTKFDPTLPRINTIKCPNQECISNNEKLQAIAEEEEEEALGTGESLNKKNNKGTVSKTQKISDTISREVIYIRYDDINMKYVYLCVHCNTMWKTDNRT